MKKVILEEIENMKYLLGYKRGVVISEQEEKNDLIDKYSTKSISNSIDSGDYGWCEETGEPIGIPRLLARPTATLSLEAQQRRELKQKLYGD